MDLNFTEVPKFTLSANELRQYTECPRKRYYASRDFLAIKPTRKNESLELGSAIHATLQFYYTECQKILDERQTDFPTYDEVDEILESLTPTSFELSEDNQKTYNCIIGCYKEQIVNDLIDYKIIECEKTFNLTNWPINNVMYHGFIDMIVMERRTGYIFFFEHKTCRDFRPAIYDRFDIQLHIYAYYGYLEYGETFGGMLLNQIKKAKTERGYANDRTTYTYDEEELTDFFNWIKAKTMAIVSPNNMHEPCNNYMSCKTCDYSSICMKYGYKLPKTTQEIVNNDFFTEDAINMETNTQYKAPMFKYEPRDSREDD